MRHKLAKVHKLVRGWLSINNIINLCLIAILLVTIPLTVTRVFQNTYNRSLAQDSSVSIEPEKGIVFAPAVVIIDPTASGEQYTLFGSLINLTPTSSPSTESGIIGN